MVSQDLVRRNFGKIDEAEGVQWLQHHLGYCAAPLLSERWILDADTTVKPLYGHQEGAVKRYNPHKLGRPSYTYHIYFLSSLRLILEVEVKAGNQTAALIKNPPKAGSSIWVCARKTIFCKGTATPGLNKVGGIMIKAPNGFQIQFAWAVRIARTAAVSALASPDSQ